MANDGSLYQSSDNINNVLKDKQFVKLGLLSIFLNYLLFISTYHEQLL